MRRFPGCWQARSGGTLLGLYALTMLASAALFLLLLYIGHAERRFTSYLSPFVILGALFLLLAFLRLRLQSRAINWLAASSLSIYLIRYSPAFFPCFRTFFRGLYAQFSGVGYLLLTLLCLLCLGWGASWLTRCASLPGSGCCLCSKGLFPRCCAYVSRFSRRIVRGRVAWKAFRAAACSLVPAFGPRGYGAHMGPAGGERKGRKGRETGNGANFGDYVAVVRIKFVYLPRRAASGLRAKPPCIREASCFGAMRPTSKNTCILSIPI